MTETELDTDFLDTLFHREGIYSEGILQVRLSWPLLQRRSPLAI